jgi:hypothetical protein
MNIELVKRQIAGLDQRIRSLSEDLQYADGPAYSQDKQRIADARAELAQWVEIERALKAQPGGVVLPERKTWNQITGREGFIETEAHNACLDEVARLNQQPASGGDDAERAELECTCPKMHSVGKPGLCPIHDASYIKSLQPRAALSVREVVPNWKRRSERGWQTAAMYRAENQELKSRLESALSAPSHGEKPGVMFGFDDKSVMVSQEAYQLFMDRERAYREATEASHGAQVRDVSAMARVLSDRQADACNVDREDQWKIYGQDFIDDVTAMLAAAPAPGKREGE